VSRPPAPLRVGLLGLGTVGREVARDLTERGEHLDGRTGRNVQLVAVGVRDSSRRRGVDLPATVRLTDDLASVASDPAVDLIVELLGGLSPAGELVLGALRRGAAVVTANKALLARNGPQLESAARECEATLRFEAAVGGGIPILGPLAADLSANTVSSVVGIVNGTTNYILGEIKGRGLPYASVLAEAQALGYAEADPRADVEGDDAADKLVLLARLAFGGWLERDAVVRQLPTVRGLGGPGITSVRPEELDAAAVVDGTLKLLAAARRGRASTSVEASVVPTIVPAESPFGVTNGVRNRIEVRAEPVGTVGFDGPGAGGSATSSAVLGDILAIARGEGSTWAGLAPPTQLSALGAGLAAAGLDQPRTWFAYLPGVSANALPTSLSATAVDGPRGTAFLSRPIAVEELRRGLAAVLEPTRDAALYPLHEAA
jgi:homoserine dehydrogenase